jgi:hypothetical protein
MGKLIEAKRSRASDLDGALGSRSMGFFDALPRCSLTLKRFEKTLQYSKIAYKKARF